MLKNAIRITVLFENPFWVGLLERSTQEGYSVAKKIFGSEPTNNEVYDFLLKQFNDFRFSQPTDDPQKDSKTMNPKRRQREAQKELNNKGTTTKAQEAIKSFQEQNKMERKENNKQRKIEEKTQKFELKQAKKKEKHRGH